MDSFLLSRVTMKNLSLIWMAMLLMPVACIEIPDLAVPPETPPGSDAGTDPQEQEPIGIQWVSPMEGAQVGSTARLQVRLTGAAPDRVELLVDGTAVSALEEPFVLDWETQSISEGPHAFVIRALRGEQEFLSAPRQVLVDRTKPRMVAQVPAHGAFEVSVLAPIEASFSEPLDPATVNGQSIQLMTETERLEATVILSEDRTTLTLRPTSPLPVNQQVRVVMADTVVDLAGNRLDAVPRGWSWFVPAYLHLGTSLTASSTQSYVESTSFGMGADLRPMVAWTGGAGETLKVHVRRWTGTSWEVIGTPLSSGRPVNAYQGTLQVDAGGSPTLAWFENPDVNDIQWFVRRWNGQAFEPVGAALTPVSQTTYVPDWRFAQGAHSSLTLATHEVGTGWNRIYVRQWRDGAWGQLGAAIELRVNSVVDSFFMDVDGQGYPFVVLREQIGGVPSNTAMRWTGTAWQDIGSTLSGRSTALSFDAGNAPLVATLDTLTGKPRTLLQKWTGSAWEPWGGALEALPGVDSTTVTSVKLDTQGRPVVVLHGSVGTDANRSGKGQVRRWNGTQWEALGGILNPSPGMIPYSRPMLGMVADDEPLLTWLEGTAPLFSDGAKVHVYRLNH
ncbi:Ig-like domain-containing protein [Corallococcus interemptor]|uniref:Ig-like domain-containing protein n=1 Tax=Corallococcus TaxID=83461 RepID=UPI001CBBFB27|nr:Ig-like domain-containing protein [Corallococcus sp. AS-1-6]MBZ4377048.1 Ig-like domain-containing protein [Corallococcus sp. AS-1-6]